MRAAGERFDFVELREEWARLAYLWAVEKRSLGSLAREFGGRDRDAWQVRCAIECFVDRRAPRWVDDYSGLPALRAKVVELLAEEEKHA